MLSALDVSALWISDLADRVFHDTKQFKKVISSNFTNVPKKLKTEFTNTKESLLKFS